MDPMTGVVLTSMVMKLILAVLAFAGMRFTLWKLDSLAGFDFREWLRNASDIGKGIYLAGRILAVCILLGIILA
jgi:hypothetical protein